MALFKHFIAIAKTLMEYQERGFLCDAVLIAKCGGQLKAHSALLAAASPVFLTALEAAPPEVPRHIYLPDVELGLLKIVINYIYTGKLVLPAVYSQMDKLAKLFVKLSELGLNLQKLHGCEMAFIRNSNKADTQTQTLEKISEVEHSYHESSKESLPKDPLTVDKPAIRKSTSLNDETEDITVIDISETVDQPNCNRTNTEPQIGASVLLKDDRCCQSEMTTKHFVSAQKRVRSKDKQRSKNFNKEFFSLTDHHDDASLSENVPDKNDVSSNQSTAGNGNLRAKHKSDLNSFVELESKNAIENETDKPNDDASIYRYFCEFCDAKDRREFLLESELSKHKKKFHWEVCHKCSFCGRRFCSQAGLRTHMKLHSGSKAFRAARKKYKCSDCDRLFYTTAQLDGHRAKHTGEKPWQCSTCGQKFTMHSSLQRHQHLHSSFRPFLCDFCGKDFVKKYSLTEHMLSTHCDAEQEYECARCEHTFKHRSEIEKHALEVHQLTKLEDLSSMIRQRDTFLCDFCGKNLISAKALKMHLKVHNAKRHHCETCDKTFASRSALNVHRRIHSGEKPYVCNICHKSFLQKPSLESHLATHSLIRPFVCIVCSKSFAIKGQLTQHMLLHTYEKAFTCGICHKQFASKSYFVIHNRTHTGDRPHVCSVCGCAFTAKHHLKRHMRVHTGERPFNCEICNKNYKNNIDLRYHYIRYHKLDFELVTFNSRVKYIFKLDSGQAVVNE